MPITSAEQKAKSIEPPIFKQMSTVTYSAMVAVAAKEMSIPPDMRTKSTPIAMMPVKALLLRMSNAFSRVRKFGLIAVMTMLNTTMMPNM